MIKESTTDSIETLETATTEQPINAETPLLITDDSTAAEPMKITAGSLRT